ncbi:MAG: DUF1311 domain-containing protein [Alphaproteobacteria bacterium]|nr:DUF1311 domain-containing protein [Alphaproteobacteria bacterium]
MIKRTLLLANVVALNAQAAPVPNCRDPMSNAEMKMCAEQDWKKAEAELDAAYGKALAEARETYRSTRNMPGQQNMPDSEAMLRDAQRAWVTFRNANCKYQYQIYWGGSHAGLAYLRCMADTTKARLKELRQLPGGDEFEP